MSGAEKNLKIADGILEDLEKKILALFENCGWCKRDKNYYSDAEKCFMFIKPREKNSTLYLYVRVSFHLRCLEATQLTARGLKSLEVDLDITDRYGNGSAEVNFKYSTGFGFSAVSGEYALVNQVKGWMNGFFGNWLEVSRIFN